MNVFILILTFSLGYGGGAIFTGVGSLSVALSDFIGNEAFAQQGT